MLSKWTLPFGSFLSYDPHGTDALSRKSRDVRYRVKTDAALQGGGTTVYAIARRMKREVPGSVLADFLDPDAVVIPMPRAGLLRAGDLWPGKRIAGALVTHGFGARVAAVVERTQAVRSSSKSPGSLRLWPDEHYATMRVDLKLEEPPSSILLVDDFITRGSTLLGAAARVAEAFPDAELRGFAVVRTVKADETLEQILDPRVGQISWRVGSRWIERDP